MSLDTAEKQKLIETHQVHPTDTGSFYNIKDCEGFNLSVQEPITYM